MIPTPGTEKQTCRHQIPGCARIKSTRVALQCRQGHSRLWTELGRTSEELTINQCFQEYIGTYQAYRVRLVDSKGCERLRRMKFGILLNSKQSAFRLTVMPLCGFLLGMLIILQLLGCHLSYSLGGEFQHQGVGDSESLSGVLALTK